MAGRVMGDSQSSWHSPPSAGIVGWTAHSALLFAPTHLLAAAVFLKLSPGSNLAGHT